MPLDRPSGLAGDAILHGCCGRCREGSGGALESLALDSADEWLLLESFLPAETGRPSLSLGTWIPVHAPEFWPPAWERGMHSCWKLPRHPPPLLAACGRGVCRNDPCHSLVHLFIHSFISFILP